MDPGAPYGSRGYHKNSCRFALPGRTRYNGYSSIIVNHILTCAILQLLTKAHSMEIFHGDSTKIDRLNEILVKKAGFDSCFSISTQSRFTFYIFKPWSLRCRMLNLDLKISMAGMLPRMLKLRMKFESGGTFQNSGITNSIFYSIHSKGRSPSCQCSCCLRCNCPENHR